MSPYPKTVRGRILRRWDSWIYYHARRSLRRIAVEHPGMSYLIELQIHDWNAAANLSPELKEAAGMFHEAMKEPGK